MTDWLSRALNALLALCAVTTTGVLVHREYSGPDTAAVTEQVSAPPPTKIRDWRRYASSGHRIGPDGAAVNIVVFSDFQCPACRVLAESLREIRRRHPGKVAIVYRHYPLPIHAAARAAAGASECAAEQHRFEAYHDALFTAQDTLGRVDWERLARAVGVPDLARFTRCTASAGTSSRIQDDVASAAHLEVRATPTILINGLRLVGAPRLYVLEEMVAREL